MLAPYFDTDYLASRLQRMGLVDTTLSPGDITVERVGGRNDNAIVLCKGRARYLLKRAYAGDSSAHEALHYEAAFCKFCEDRDKHPGLSGLVPRLVASDTEASAFYYELFEESTALWSAYHAACDTAATASIGAQLGRSLARFHRGCMDLEGKHESAWISCSIPPAFTIHRPGPSHLSMLSGGAHKLISILQKRSHVCDHIDDMRGRWKARTITHGDIRSDNVLVSFAGDSKDRPEVHFVDFETVQFGDPMWDVAGALQDAAYFWLRSMTPNADTQKMVASAKHSLAEIQVIARAILHGYFNECGLESQDSEQFTTRIIRFSAVRMLQTAYEATAETDDLPADAVLLLQIAENVLNDPRAAARGFYGVVSE